MRAASPSELEPITLKPATNRDRVILEVRNLFLSGQLKPNQHIVEADLSERLGVSRTPIREAFRELTQIGLLVGEPFKGMRLADIDMSEIRQAYEVRAELEGLTAATAAERINPEELNRLTSLNDEMRRSQRNVARCTSINDEFHLTLGQAAKNKVLAEMVAILRARVGSFRVVFHYHPALVSESIRGHDEILAGLRERSAEKSRAAMRRHIVIGVTQTSSVK